jgi:hypothetical protein
MVTLLIIVLVISIIAPLLLYYYFTESVAQQLLAQKMYLMSFLEDKKDEIYGQIFRCNQETLQSINRLQVEIINSVITKPKVIDYAAKYRDPVTGGLSIDNLEKNAARAAEESMKVVHIVEEEN